MREMSSLVKASEPVDLAAVDKPGGVWRGWVRLDHSLEKHPDVLRDTARFFTTPQARAKCVFCFAETEGVRRFLPLISALALYPPSLWSCGKPRRIAKCGGVFAKRLWVNQPRCAAVWRLSTDAANPQRSGDSPAWRESRVSRP